MSRELCIMACVFCRDGAFQTWAVARCAEIKLDVPGGPGPGMRERFAKALILNLADVTSRNDLDTDPDAAARFHDLVRKPFLAWKEGRP